MKRFVCTIFAAAVMIVPVFASDVIRENEQRDCEEKILAMLETFVFYDVKESVTLEQAAKRLANENGINTFIDWGALRETNVGPETKFKLRLPCEMPLKDVLTYLVRQHDLSWTVKNEMLVITSEKKSRGNKVVRSFYVKDLLSVKPGFENVVDPTGVVSMNELHDITAHYVTKYDFEPIMDYIRTMVAPESWKEDGEMMEYYPNQSLVVRQTEDVHKEINELLAKLRKTKEASKVAEVSPVKR